MALQLRRLLTLALSAAFVLSCIAPAPKPTTWYVNGEKAPDTHWYKTSGNFGAQLIITDAADALYEYWENVPGGVPIKRLDATEPGTRIETVVFFVGCTTNQAGNCEIEALATVTTGSGRTLVDEQPITLSMKPKPEGYNLGISELGVGLQAIAEDEFYSFKMRIFDRVANESVTLTQDVQVQP